MWEPMLHTAPAPRETRGSTTKGSQRQLLMDRQHPRPSILQEAESIPEELDTPFPAMDDDDGHDPSPGCISCAII
ncbi:unnamed protein product [Cylicostephanus goldi]|uniref:Uncharacterized protein n=1 Tax=Cylicostephanus goldi TaxID=71465 RepID=A0A3P6SIN2_CYLGO|nr:unnamed protein product [Cylicostephanus goldi]